MDGSQPRGTVGGDTVAGLLREARNDSNVKAVVLRVDSPGGSAFASEVIRNEIEALKAAGNLWWCRCQALPLPVVTGFR